MNEIWKDIEGFEGFYMVSNKGRVKGLDRHYKRKNSVNPGFSYQFQRGMILKDSDVLGYRKVFLQKNGAAKQVFVHRLVATAFIPNPENKQCVNHINGDKAHNHVNNLEWCTHSENNKHAYKNGLHQRGEKSHKAKLTKSDVIAIRKAYKAGGITQKELAKKYNVARQHVSKLVNGKQWKHLPHEEAA